MLLWHVPPTEIMLQTKNTPSLQIHSKQPPKPLPAKKMYLIRPQTWFRDSLNVAQSQRLWPGLQTSQIQSNWAFIAWNRTMDGTGVLSWSQNIYCHGGTIQPYRSAVQVTYQSCHCGIRGSTIEQLIIFSLFMYILSFTGFRHLVFSISFIR